MSAQALDGADLIVQAGDLLLMLLLLIQRQLAFDLAYLAQLQTQADHFADEPAEPGAVGLPAQAFEITAQLLDGSAQRIGEGDAEPEGEHLCARHGVLLVTGRATRPCRYRTWS